MTKQVGYAPMTVFRGYRSDYGAGLGNVFTGLLRAAVPLLAPAVKDIGRTLISAGTNRLNKVIRDNISPKEEQPLPVQRSRKRKQTIIRHRPPNKRPFARRRRTKADISQNELATGRTMPLQ